LFKIVKCRDLTPKTQKHRGTNLSYKEIPDFTLKGKVFSVSLVR